MVFKYEMDTGKQMTKIEKRILENQEIMMLAICHISHVQENYAPNDICLKLMACYDETREVLGKELMRPNQYHFTEI